MSEVDREDSQFHLLLLNKECALDVAQQNLSGLENALQGFLGSEIWDKLSPAIAEAKRARIKDAIKDSSSLKKTIKGVKRDIDELRRIFASTASHSDPDEHTFDQVIAV